MRIELIQDLFHHLDSNDSLKIGYADESTTRALEELDIPLDLKRTLQWYWTTSGGIVGPYTLDSVNVILANNDFSKLFQSRMIPIGFAVNGDILVIRTANDGCNIGLVSHEIFWEEECGPVEAYVEITQTIDEYLWRSVEGRYLPIDYYSATELAELRDDVTENKSTRSSDVPSRSA